MFAQHHAQRGHDRRDRADDKTCGNDVDLHDRKADTDRGRINTGCQRRCDQA